MKTCSSCRQAKLLDEFSKKAASKDGLMSACRLCNSTNSQRWAAQNRARKAAIQARYRKRTYEPTGGFVVTSAKPHVLYRAYDAEGLLLYVGISVDVRRRVAQHRREKPWWASVDRVEHESHPNREAAQEAETAAILAENPRYNLRKRGPAVY